MMATSGRVEFRGEALNPWLTVPRPSIDQTETMGKENQKVHLMQRAMIHGFMDEVSDPEMWMGLHHYSSDSDLDVLDEGTEQPSGSTGH